MKQLLGSLVKNVQYTYSSFRWGGSGYICISLRLYCSKTLADGEVATTAAISVHINHS